MLFGQGRVTEKVGCITTFLHSINVTREPNENGRFSARLPGLGLAKLMPGRGQYKTRTADYGLRTTDYGLGIKYGLRYKTRTEHYGLSIKHEERSYIE